MRLISIALLLVGASAFAPIRPAGQTASRASAGAMRAVVDDMIGADVETNGVWDPLGLAADEASLFRRRAVELKHGRVCMLAVFGYLVTDAGYHPLYDGNLEPGITALFNIPTAGLVQILFAIGVFELSIGKQDYENKAPGDISGFGNAFIPEDPEEFAKLQLREVCFLPAARAHPPAAPVDAAAR